MYFSTILCTTVSMYYSLQRKRGTHKWMKINDTKTAIKDQTQLENATELDRYILIFCMYMSE